MSFQVKAPESIIPVGAVKVLLYGPPGVRKTTFAMTADECIVGDADNGMRRVSTKYRSNYGALLNWGECIDFAQYIADKTQHGFKTAVVDTVGKSLDALGEFLKSSNPKFRQADGSLTIKAYGALSSVWRQGFYNTLVQSGLDLVFVSHHKEDKGQGDEVFTRPDIPGQTLGSLTREMDLVGYVHIRQGKYCVTFTPSESYYAKNSANLPDFIYMDKMSLAEIIALFKEAVNAESSEWSAYMDQIGLINTQVEAATSPEELNGVVSMCADISKNNGWIYTAKTEAQQLIKIKGDVMLWTRDKTGYFETPGTVPADPDATQQPVTPPVAEPAADAQPAPVAMTPEQLAADVEPAGNVQQVIPQAVPMSKAIADAKAQQAEKKATTPVAKTQPGKNTKPTPKV